MYRTEDVLKNIPYLFPMVLLAPIRYIVFGLLAIILLAPNLVLAQNFEKKVDSILDITTSQEYDKRKEKYTKIADLINNTNGENAKRIFDHTLLRDTSDLAKMVLNYDYSRRLSRQGLTKEALALKLEGLKFAEKLNDERAQVFYQISIGNNYLFQNVVDKALFHLNKGEELALKEAHKDLLWNVYYNKALLVGASKKYDEATQYYEKMWNTIKVSKNAKQRRFALYVAVDYFSQVDYPAQLAKYTELLAQEYENVEANTPSGHMPIKSIFNKRTSPENIPIYKETIRISDSLKAVNSFAYASFGLAETYNKLGQRKLAIACLKNVENKMVGLGKPQILMQAYESLTNTFVAAKDYKQAFHYRGLEASLRDSITSEKMQKNLAALEVKFETEKKERQIAEQASTIEKKTLQRNQTLIGLGASVVLLALLFMFFRNKLKYQKTIASQTEVVQQQKITELQQKNKLLALNSMIEGQEAERLRIAKDLHDSLGGLLSTVKVHFSTIQKEIEQLEKFNLTEKTNDLIDEACLEVRRISHNMMPHALSISGLKGAVEDMAESLNEQGYNTTLEITDVPEKMEPTREVMIYRLLQEIISNIRKHANATTILIQLLGHQNDITLLVEDDGQGFDYANALQSGGLGLKSINSRVEFLDGTVDWDSQSGKGTSITIVVPNLKKPTNN